MRAPWRTPDVWAICLSAFCADAGYQSVLVGLPLFLVLVLREPVWVFGLAMAVAYGGGAIVAWVGGRLGDRIGHRKVAITGNVFIPLLSFTAIAASPFSAVALVSGGWWARNFRSPSRRAMLSEAVPDEGSRSAAFGFLHALDVGGGVVAALYVIVALSFHVPFRWIFLGTVVPLVASTLLLIRAKTGAPVARLEIAGGREVAEPVQRGEPAPPGTTALLLAAALYGFTSYAVGFPVLTAAQKGHGVRVGVVAFLLFQAVSALTGYAAGGRLGKGVVASFSQLGLLGYLAAGIGTAAGRGFGALSAARSVGVFTGNLVMGLLYSLGPQWSYAYAAAVAVAAAAIIVRATPSLRRSAVDLDVS